MFNIHKFNKNNLEYKKISNTKIYMSVITLCGLVFLLGIFIGFSIGVTEEKQDGFFGDDYDGIVTKESLFPTKNKTWVDSTFKDYAVRANLYLSRPIFKGTPLNGDMMALAARNAYDSTGILLPVELALVQAQWESGMGREGKSPKNNPYNIGEFDETTTVMWFNSTFDGVQKYYYTMCSEYLRCRTVEQLLVNFVNCGGLRYSPKDSYERHIHNDYVYIKRWINKNLKR